MNRFVILEHDHPELHWDLMLEEPEGLATWRLAIPLQEFGIAEHGLLNQNAWIEATRLKDHRKAYLDYEGPVSRQRGQVRQVDRGLYIPLQQTSQQWEFRLEGKQISGFGSLHRCYDSPTDWKFRFVADD